MTWDLEEICEDRTSLEYFTSTNNESKYKIDTYHGPRPCKDSEVARLSSGLARSSFAPAGRHFKQGLIIILHNTEVIRSETYTL